MADDVTIDPSSVHDVQVARLDADMFNADDIDGTTEGLVGSGNLNYLVLQSSQTNEAGINANPFEVNLGGDGQNGLFPGLFGNGIAPTSDSRAINPSDLSHNGDSSGFLTTALNNSSTQFNDASETNNNNSNSSLNTISATHSSLSSSTSASETNNNIFPGDDGSDGINGNDGNGNNGSNGNNGLGQNGNNGNNGNNGIDGHSPEPPVPPTPIDSHIGVHVVSDILGANLDLLVNPIGNLVGGINVDATAILGDILSPDDGLLPHPGLILDGIIGDNTILNNTPVGPLLTQTEEVLDTAVNHVNTVVSDLLPAVPGVLDAVGGLLNQVNGDSGIFVTTGLNLPGIGGLGGLGDLSLHIPTTVLDNIIGTTNLHLDLLTDQSGLLTNGLQLAPVDLGILSSGDVLGGLTTGITTDDLLGSTVGTVQDLVGNLTDGGDIVGNLIPDAANIPGNLITEVTSLVDPVTGIVQSLADGNVLGTVNTGEVDATVHDLLNQLPLDQIPGGDVLADNVNATVDSVTDAIAPVTDGVTDLLHGILDPVLDQVANLGGAGLTDNLTDALHGIADGVPTGDILAPVADLTAPVADTLNDLATGDLTGSLDPTHLADTLQGVVGDLAGGGGDPLGGLTDTLQDLTGGLGGGGDILAPVTDVVDNLLGGGGTDPLGGLTDTLQDLTGGLGGGGDITAPITDIIGGLSGGGGDPLAGLTDTLNGLTDGLTGGDITAPVTDLVDNLGGGTDPLGGLTDTLQGLTDTIPGGDVLGNLLGGGGNAPGTPDTDLTVHTGIDLVDNTLGLPDIGATLDPVENLVGDVDLGVNVDTDAVNQLLSGDIQGTIDSLTNTASNALDLNLSLLNPEPGQNAPIGLDIGNGGSSISDILSGLGGAAGADAASSSASWPEATVASLGDTVSSTLGATLGATLPDPVGILTEGLNLIHDSGGGSSSGGGALGGLLGGGGHHGLFG